jgi:hypothetical protein
MDGNAFSLDHSTTVPIEILAFKRNLHSSGG